MPPMIECLLLHVALLRAAVRHRADVAAENLLLRHQLAVLSRQTRKRPRLCARDKLLRLLARLARRDWLRDGNTSRDPLTGSDMLWECSDALRR